jgi:leucyl aminopeptidase (aminopeptidase T)
MNERQALEASIIDLSRRLASLSVTEKAELDKLDAKLRMLEAKEAMLKAEAAMLDARKKLEDDPGDPRKIAWSEEAKRDLDRAREHYYEMCRLWGVLATPVQQAAATAVGSQGTRKLFGF